MLVHSNILPSGLKSIDKIPFEISLVKGDLYISLSIINLPPDNFQLKITPFESPEYKDPLPSIAKQSTLPAWFLWDVPLFPFHK